MSGATISVVVGVVGAMGVAGLVATGCGGDDNGGSNTTTTSTSKTTTSTSPTSSTTGTSTTTTGTTSTSSSSTSTSSMDGGKPDGDAAPDSGPTLCNTAAMLLGDAGSLLFSFDDGGIVTANASWQTASYSSPADAQPTATTTITGDPVVGYTCPGSLLVTIPYTNFAQDLIAQVNFGSPPGAGATGTAIHLALKAVLVDSADGAALPLSNILTIDGGSYSYIQTFAQWGPQTDDGGPIADSSYYFTAKDYQNVNNGFGGFPSDGGFLLQTIPITVPVDGSTDGAVQNATSPVMVNLSQIGIRVVDIQQPAGQPLPENVTLKLYVDDIYVQ